MLKWFAPLLLFAGKPEVVIRLVVGVLAGAVLFFGVWLISNIAVTFDALKNPAIAAAYGVVLGMAAVSYILLQWAIVACNGRSSRLAAALGNDLKGKASLAMYAASIPLAFVSPWIAVVLYVAVALIWFVPDRRIEAILKQ